LESQITRQRTVAPFGTWSSPITARMVAESGVRLSMPWLEDGSVWWLEGRAAEAGRVALVRMRQGEERADVVPDGFNVRTSPAIHVTQSAVKVARRG